MQGIDVVDPNDLNAEAAKFEGLKKDELVSVAEYFGTDSSGSKSELAERLVDDGVRYTDYENLYKPVQEEKAAEVEVEAEAETRQQPDVPVVQEQVVETTPPGSGKQFASGAGDNEEVVIKMTARRLSHYIEGHKFTAGHPFAVMPRSKAERVLKRQGFREATPREVQQFYS